MKVILLGAIQGLAEFLPVSSSGHLVLFKHLFRLQAPGAALEAALHLGTLAAVVVVYRRDVFKLILAVPGLLKTLCRGKRGFAQALEKGEYRLLLLLFAALLPTVFFGLFFKDFLESLFDNLPAVGLALFGTGLLLFLSRRALHGSRKLGRSRFSDALAVGIAQACAIVPGFSRSGFTISAGLLRGMERGAAARFSFLLSLPAVLGAVALKTPDILGSDGGKAISPAALLSGIGVSFIVGWLALTLLLRFLSRGKFSYFSFYCFFAGAVALFLGLLS